MSPKISELGRIINIDLTGQATEELVDTVIEAITDRDRQIQSLRSKLLDRIRREQQLADALNEAVEEADRYAEIVAKVWHTEHEMPPGLAEQVRAIAETDLAAMNADRFIDDEIQFFEDWIDAIPEDPLLEDVVRVFRRWGLGIELRLIPTT